MRPFTTRSRRSTCPGADIVLRSSAYKEDNVEVAEALRRGIPVWKREDAWRFLAEGKRVIAVAGTHGKSTTTALVWSALRAGNVDASLICGAVLRGIGANAHAGSSDVLVIEADEYDNTFHALRPLIAIVTTVDHDHIDMFPTRESYRDAFRTFARGIVPRGTLVTCLDDEGGRDLAAFTTKELERDVLTYGTDAGADLRVVAVRRQQPRTGRLRARRHAGPPADPRSTQRPQRGRRRSRGAHLRCPGEGRGGAVSRSSRAWSAGSSRSAARPA